MELSKTKKIVFLLLVVFSFFSISEIVTRAVVRWEKSRREPLIQYVVDDDLFWRYRPNQQVLQPSKGVYYYINSEGLRGPEFPPRKPANERRLLAIGDSVTFGFLVSEEETYPYFLEEYLEDILADTLLRVINGGINAYSTREELMFLRRRGIEYDPDIVILGFVLNDASLYAREYQRKRFREILTRDDRRGRSKNIHGFFSGMYFVRAAGWVLRMVMPGGESMPEMKEVRGRLNREIMYLENDEAVIGWETAMSELQEVADLLNGQGVDMVFVIFPTLYQIEADPVPDKPQEMYRDFCEKNSIPFIDLLPSFIDYDGGDLFLDHVHLSPEGNGLAAREIGDFLVDSGMIGRR